uniref:Enoyl reductase (ER) domain-containing protein n=1 Tax=Timema bartmani TaxID=61472 RepID=A0A7R9I163_9NEOP|nr:unnamed protein product [Timema bartmani]
MGLAILCCPKTIMHPMYLGALETCYIKAAVSVEEKSPVIFLAGDEHIWPQQLKSELNISNRYNKRVYVVINKKAPIDGKTLIQQLSKEPKADKLRYISILDENAPNFSLTEDNIYLQQLQQDLVCNVYSEGSWGSFRRLPIDEMTEKPISLSLLPALRARDWKITIQSRYPPGNNQVVERHSTHALALMLKITGQLDVIKKLNDIGNLELSGTLEDGRRVMSIVQNTKDPIHNSLDPYLTWDIPESWSLEDAATVPWAYSTAYHGMIQAAALSSEETVLIHAGHTPIGQAAIAFALHIGSTVFTTVTEIVHKKFLMKRFPLDITLAVVGDRLGLVKSKSKELDQGQEDLNQKVSFTWNDIKGQIPGQVDSQVQPPQLDRNKAGCAMSRSHAGFSLDRNYFLFILDFEQVLVVVDEDTSLSGSSDRS